MRNVFYRPGSQSDKLLQPDASAGSHLLPLEAWEGELARESRSAMGERRVQTDRFRWLAYGGRDRASSRAQAEPCPPAPPPGAASRDEAGPRLEHPGHRCARFPGLAARPSSLAAPPALENVTRIDVLCCTRHRMASGDRVDIEKGRDLYSAEELAVLERVATKFAVPAGALLELVRLEMSFEGMARRRGIFGELRRLVSHVANATTESLSDASR